MVAKRRGVWKTVSGATQFTLTPDDGESILIQEIMIDTPSTNWATLKTAQTTVGYWPVGGTQGNCLHFPITDSDKPNLYRDLLNKGIFRPYPVGQGETFSITGVHQSTSKVSVKYDIYPENEITNKMPNGSQGKELDFINMGGYSTTLADGENKYVTQITSSEFPPWPWSGNVPQNRSYKVHGYCFTDISKATLAPISTQQTKFVRFQMDQVSLFDDQISGIPHEGGTYVSNGETIGSGLGVGGFYTEVDQRPFVNFDPVLVANPGSELNVYVQTELDSGSINLAADDAYIGLICTLEKRG